MARRTTRAMLAGLWLGAALSALACGKTYDHRLGDAQGQGGEPGAGNAPGAPGKGGSAVGGSSVVVGGAAGKGGSVAGNGGQTNAIAGNGGQTNALSCIQGARCECDNDVGTLSCDGASELCICPAAEICEKKLGSCFEPCGGEPYGAWVLEQTCLPGSSTSQGCSGGVLRGAGTVNDLRLQILENEAIAAIGNEALALEARVPLACLGIDSVNRCVDAMFYAAPLLYSLSSPLRCEATECGDCKCTGSASALAGFGFPGQGVAWQPGSQTLSFDAMKVPYCVAGDTLWVGGELSDGTPKVSYKFRRSSCAGAPVPCEQRVAPDCGTDGSCYPGRCVATGNQDCEGLGSEACSAAAGCMWRDADKCFGYTAERCEFRNCDATPGCSWGPPQARCGGEPKRCYTYEPGECPTALGCERSNCIWGDGPDEPVNCYAIMSSSVCATAVGCAQSGYTCAGFTRCWDQTDAQACSSLGCSVVASPQCDGSVNVRCSELSVADCRTVPGCRVEW